MARTLYFKSSDVLQVKFKLLFTNYLLHRNSEISFAFGGFEGQKYKWFLYGTEYKFFTSFWSFWSL